jgi:hypothetical protein
MSRTHGVPGDILLEARPSQVELLVPPGPVLAVLALVALVVGTVLLIKDDNLNPVRGQRCRVSLLEQLLIKKFIC